MPPAPVSVPQVPPHELPWAERIDTLGLDGGGRQLARQCAWLGEKDGVIRLGLAASAAFLLHETRRAAMEQALAAQYGREVRLLIESAQAEEAVALTPAQLDQKRTQERQRAAEAAIAEDPVVRAFKDQFGAAVRSGSIQPH